MASNLKQQEKTPVGTMEMETDVLSYSSYHSNADGSMYQTCSDSVSNFADIEATVTYESDEFMGSCNNTSLRRAPYFTKSQVNVRSWRSIFRKLK